MSWAATYLGIPFRDRGLTRDGCDCYGLYRLILQEQCAIELPEYPEVSAGATMKKMKEIVQLQEAVGEAGSSWTEVEKGHEQPFDCVLMRGQMAHEGRRYSRPIHIGCVVKKGTLIHIEDGSDVTVVDYERHPFVRNRVVGFYRLARA